MNRKEILESAERCVCTDRQSEYGSVEDNFNMIAQMWSVYTGAEIDAKDVACMMTMLKIARIKTGVQKADSWIDIAGYAACGGEIATTLKCESPLNESKICEFEHPDGCLACQYNCDAEPPDIHVEEWKCSKCNAFYSKYPKVCGCGSECFYPTVNNRPIITCKDCAMKLDGCLEDIKCTGCERYELLKQ